MFRSSSAQPAQPRRRHRIRIHIGEVVASAQPIVIDTLLGSCVAVCLRDPVSRVGGMNHILLPGADESSQTSRFGVHAMGVHAMESLINELTRHGGDRRRFVAKAFGGANVVGGLSRPTVGDLNAAFVREFLAHERIALIASRLGGNDPVRVHFTTDTGRVMVQTIKGPTLPALLDAESSYQKSRAADKESSGKPSLLSGRAVP